MEHSRILIVILISVFSCKNEKTEIIVSYKDTSTENIIFTPKEANLIEFECPQFDFKTDRVQADSIVKFFEMAKMETDNKKIEFEKKFFCSFPNSFKEMENIFGFNSETGESAVLYDYSGGVEGANNGRGIMSHSIIKYFANLKSIPPKKYYDKFVNICINGTWQADNIIEGFYIYKRFENDTKSICDALSKKSQKDIYSVFKFIFDGPHPENEHNDEIFNRIYPLISKENIELGNTLKKAYDELIRESSNRH